jgi:23S rRNA (guanosine2251-2'-O)-methyltransferase
MRKLNMDELGRKTVEEFRQAPKTPLVLVLDNVRSMNNVGSVFRTADAFLVQGIILCGYTPTPPHRDIQKTALGATETVTWQYASTTLEAVQELKKAGYKIYAVEQVSQSTLLDQFQPDTDHPMALIFGNEVYGVEEQLLPLVDGCIEIPQLGTKHSLNISVSVGIVVWDLFSKLKYYQKES